MNRRNRLIRLAKLRNDRLEDFDDTYRIFVGVRRLRVVA